MYSCGQISNPNMQIPNKFKISNLQCSKQSLAPVANSFVLVIGILAIRICLGFGAWDLGFMDWEYNSSLYPSTCFKYLPV
jgi:hypothetical protein